jgi:hypothetical protein
MEQGYTILDDYFNGLLSETEREAVRQRVAKDPDFAAAFDLRQRMEQWVSAEPLRQKVQDLTTGLGEEFFVPAQDEAPLRVLKKPTLWVRRALLAAATVALLVVAWQVMQSKQDLYAAYAQHTTPELTTRGTLDETQAAAERAFEQKAYDQALASFQTLRRTDDQPLYQLYEAICLIELRRPAEARLLLQPVSNGLSALSGEAQWYEALSYLRENNRITAGEVLARITPDNARYRKAQELLRKL